MDLRQIKYYLFIVLVSLFFFSQAQPHQFRNLTMADGLSHSVVYAIGQDKYGYMWIGTGNGLNIYNGVRFNQIYSQPANEKTISYNSIEDFLFENDSVWIATRRGLCVMNVQTKECRRIELGENTDIRTIYKDTEPGIYWIGTQTGLIKYNNHKGTYQEYNTSNSNISNDIIRAIYKDSDGNLWVGTFDKLNKLSKGSAVFAVLDMKWDYRPSIKNNLTMSILPFGTDNDSILWIGTQTGLILLNRFTKEKRFFREENSNLTNSAIKALLKSGDGNLWMGTDFGLGKMNPEFNIEVYLHDPYENKSLINSIVWDIFEDNSGILWFGTNNGLSILSKADSRFRFYPMSFTRENNIAGYEIRKVSEDSKENIWLGTQFGFVTFHPQNGIIQTFNSEQPEPRKLSINGAKCLLEDSKGRIWMGTNGGINIWNPSQKKLDKYTADFNSSNGLRTNYITQIFELKDGTILVNTIPGLHKAEKENGIYTFRFLGHLGINLYQGENCLYSYNDSVLFKIDLETYKISDEISFRSSNDNYRINTLYLDNNETIWLGLNNGIIKYNISTKQYRHFKIKSNRDYPVINLLSDKEGNIWASSYSAILRFLPETKDFEIYPSSEEIPINRFMEDCCLKCKNGDIIFGGHDGFIRFNPNNIKKNDVVFPVAITGLFLANQKIIPDELYNNKKVLQKDISFMRQLDLDYLHRSFSLEFTTLQFDERDGIRYAYKLEGLDPDWIYTNGAVGNAVYSNLRAGDYKFRLRGTNNHGVWNENETILGIKIKPPFWASPYMIVFYAVLFVLVILGLIYYFSYRAQMRNELKIAHLEKEHSDNIAKARQQFFTNISHEFRTPLSLIIGPVEKLAQNSGLDTTARGFVQLIENNARRLLWLNNQLLDFRKLEKKSLDLQVSEFGIIQFARNIFELFTDKAERKQIDYTFNTDIEQLIVKMDLRKIETILFNLLSNAFKFTPQYGQIHVSINPCIHNSGDGFCISIKDTGIGISKADQQQIFERFYQAKEAVKMERGLGIGLTLVREYVQMHKGKIEINSNPGEGSEFKVILPLIVNYESENLVDSEPESKDPSLKPIGKENIEEQIISSFSGNPFILLVEDDIEIADFIRVSLNNKYNVKHVLNGKDALQVISKQLPDLVICDILMPEMDGIEFTKYFKSNPKTAHIPLILLTGQTETKKQLEGLKSGADAYITKPFEIDLLEVRIKNFLRRSEQIIQFAEFKRISNPREIKLVSQDEKLLENIVICIEKHISDPDLDIDKVCKETGLSHSVLYRKIKSLTGQTANEFIRTVRIRRAEQLLRTKKFSVSEVMYETGFSNHSYFSKCFRKLYKMSPKEYVEQV